MIRKAATQECEQYFSWRMDLPEKGMTQRFWHNDSTCLAYAFIKENPAVPPGWASMSNDLRRTSALDFCQQTLIQHCLHAQLGIENDKRRLDMTSFADSSSEEFWMLADFAALKCRTSKRKLPQEIVCDCRALIVVFGETLREELNHPASICRLVYRLDLLIREE